MARMEIVERRNAGVTVLALAGRLVLDEGELPLREHIDRLIAANRLDIVLNLHDVTYMDSCGVGAVVSKYVSLRRRGGHMKLVCPSERCRRVLSITHLLPLFESYESEDAAVASFASAHAASDSGSPTAS